MAYYATRGAGGRLVDVLQFESEILRDRWVDAGWGRLAADVEDIPSGLNWQTEELFNLLEPDDPECVDGDDVYPVLAATLADVQAK